MGDFKLVQLVGGGIGVQLSLQPMGAYSVGEIYSPGMAVSYEGSSYAAIKNTQGNLPTDTAFWMVVALKGLDGEGILADYVAAMDAANLPSGLNAFATVADIPTAPGDVGAAPALGPDDNYVTDAEKVKLANTSGVNTGDQDLSGKLNADSGTATNLKESKQYITSAVTTLAWGQHIEIDYAGNIDLSTGGITGIPTDDTEAFMVITQHHNGGLRSINWGATQPIGGAPTARGTTYTVYCLRPSAVPANSGKYFVECVGGR